MRTLTTIPSRHPRRVRRRGARSFRGARGVRDEHAFAPLLDAKAASKLLGIADSRVSGHVILRQGPRGPVYYLKYRLPDGRQVKRRLGKAWTERGRAPAGYYTPRTAEEALQNILSDARRGTLAGMTTLNAKFADASAEWLRYVQHDRDVKPSTLSDYRHMAKRLDRTFGETPIERIDAEDIELWRGGLSCSNRTSQKYLIALNGIFKRAMKVYRLPSNPMTLVERPRVRHSSEIDVLSAAEVLRTSVRT